MTNMYYECTVKYEQVQETGLIKKVSEKYLVEALSFTEAEKRIIDEMQQYANGEFDITAIRRLSLAEILESKDAAADRWYKAKIAFITLDEKSGKEKRTSVEVLVQASDFDDARNAINEAMKGTLGEWEKAVLSETSYVDVFK